MKTWTYVVALVCTGFGCGGGDDNGDDDDDRVLPDAPPDRTDEFVGTWNAFSGDVELDCDDDTRDSVDPFTGSQDFALGTDSDLVAPDPQATSDCPVLTWDVSRSKATVRTNRCSESSDGLTIVASFSRYDLVLDAAGDQIAVTARGTLTASGTVTASCTISMDGFTMRNRFAREARSPWTPVFVSVFR